MSKYDVLILAPKSPVLFVLKRLKDSGLTLYDQVQRDCASPRMAYELPKDRVKALKERKEPSQVTVAAPCARFFGAQNS